MDRAPTAVQITRVLHDIRAVESEEQAERKRQEAQFEQAVRDYILNVDKQFAHGGVVNALATVAHICEELSDTSEDYLTAAKAIDEVLLSVDLKYARVE